MTDKLMGAALVIILAIGLVLRADEPIKSNFGRGWFGGPCLAKAWC